MEKTNKKAVRPEERFDFLYVNPCDFEKKRLSFKEALKVDPELICGIFPFHDSYFFIESVEFDARPRNQIADFEESLPTVFLCEKFFEIKTDLNKAMSVFGIPPLEGCYFATKTSSSFNWIVSFDGDENLPMPVDYYEDSEPAKIRCVGDFASHETCI